MTAGEVEQRCIEARRRFYSLSSIFRRSLDYQANGRGWFMWSHFYSINLLFRSEVMQRRNFPLGDEAYSAPLMKAEHSGRSTRTSWWRWPDHGHSDRPRDCRPTMRTSVGCCAASRCRDGSRFPTSASPSFRGAATPPARTPRFSWRAISRPASSPASPAGRSARCIVNGAPTRLGYLGQLRIDRRYRGRWLVSRGFSMLKQLHDRDPLPGYLAAVTVDNREAEGILVRKGRKAVSGVSPGRPLLHPRPSRAARGVRCPGVDVGHRRRHPRDRPLSPDQRLAPSVLPGVERSETDLADGTISACASRTFRSHGGAGASPG